MRVTLCHLEKSVIIENYQGCGAGAGAGAGAAGADTFWSEPEPEPKPEKTGQLRLRKGKQLWKNNGMLTAK